MEANNLQRVEQPLLPWRPARSLHRASVCVLRPRTMRALLSRATVPVPRCLWSSEPLQANEGVLRYGLGSPLGEVHGAGVGAAWPSAPLVRRRGGGGRGGEVIPGGTEVRRARA